MIDKTLGKVIIEKSTDNIHWVIDKKETKEANKLFNHKTMIDKTLLKKIKNGNFGALMEGIEFLIDTYHEKSFNNGYESCKADLGIHSMRLAEAIAEEARKRNNPAEKDMDYYLLTQEETEKIIDEYFKSI